MSPPLEGRAVGIDLGTTFAALAHIDDQGRPVVMPDEDDEERMSSLIVLGEGGRFLAGLTPMRAAMEAPERIFQHVKRHLGCGDFQRTLGGKPIPPEFITALVLKKLCGDAEPRIGRIDAAVISVPYAFNDAQRQATVDAARIAGLETIELVNEPVAAALASAWRRKELAEANDGPVRHVLVYHLGGGTFDVTVIRATAKCFQTLATDGDARLGGLDWTERLVDHVCREFKTCFEVDLCQAPAAMQVLRSDCDLAKIELSEGPQTAIVCRHAGKSLRAVVKRGDFETMTADLLKRTVDASRAVLQQAKISAEQLDAVLLTGGGTLLPQVSRMLKELTGKEPSAELAPHTAVAEGAAIQAAALAMRLRGEKGDLPEAAACFAEIRQENVSSRGLGIVAANPAGGEMNRILIPRNTRLPVTLRMAVKTNRPGQDCVALQLVEGDAADPRAGALWGKCRIAGLPPGLPPGAPIEVAYAIDACGRITLAARDKASGKEATVEGRRRAGLDEKQVLALARLAKNCTVK